MFTASHGIAAPDGKDRARKPRQHHMGCTQEETTEQQALYAQGKVACPYMIFDPHQQHCWFCREEEKSKAEQAKLEAKRQPAERAKDKAKAQQARLAAASSPADVLNAASQPFLGHSNAQETTKL